VAQRRCAVRRQRHVRRNGIAVLALGIVAGCSASPGTPSADHQKSLNEQTVTGKFVRVGGPAPGSAVPLPGTITARAATGKTFTAAAGSHGRFTLSLPPGTYRVTGRSPLMQSGQMVCGGTARLRVRSDRPAPRVTVVCSIP
jgi:hypothetical protein